MAGRPGPRRHPHPLPRFSRYSPAGASQHRRKSAPYRYRRNTSKTDIRRYDRRTRNVSNALFGKLISQIRTEIRYRHYAIRTEHTYISWIKRFLYFHKLKPAESLGTSEIKAYLEYLAVVREISASTQNQAFNALVFIYTHVLNRPGMAVKSPADF